MLPQTGFIPNQKTQLHPQVKPYSLTASQIRISIPALFLKTQIFGVPRTEEEPSGYDVSWLGNNVGWLQDTAFPGRLDGGNAVLTGHVVNYEGKSAPFIALERLQYGDQIMIEAFGERYTYLVTDVMVVAKDNFKIMEPTEQPTLTLLICKYFNEETQSI